MYIYVYWGNGAGATTGQYAFVPFRTQAKVVEHALLNLFELVATERSIIVDDATQISSASFQENHSMNEFGGLADQNIDAPAPPPLRVLDGEIRTIRFDSLTITDKLFGKKKTQKENSTPEKKILPPPTSNNAFNKLEKKLYFADKTIEAISEVIEEYENYICNSQNKRSILHKIQKVKVISEENFS